MSPSSTASDSNFSGRTTPSDFNLFGTRYLAEHPAADYNGDGEVTADDLATYIEDYAAE